MDEMENTMIGRGRDAIEMIVDAGSFEENKIGTAEFDPDYGPGAVVGTAKLKDETVTVIANDAYAFNDRFPVVFGGVIGLEEGYKMATAVYRTMEADKDKPEAEKRPIVLIVDTPGNGPGKMEEIAGMNKSTGAYQLALAEARKSGHPIVAMVIGRAISGAFLCHGLQADEILALSPEFGTMIHVMPLTSISRITKMDIERQCIKYVNKQTINLCKKLVDTYNADPTPENYLTLLYNIPVGFRLTARMTTNYRQLKTIYQQRRNHRLPEWKIFCRWIEGLWNSEFITGGAE